MSNHSLGNKFIGLELGELLNDSNPISKNHALIFDQIAVMNSSHAASGSETMAANLDFLFRNGVIFEARENLNLGPQIPPDVRGLMGRLTKLSRRMALEEDTALSEEVDGLLAELATLPSTEHDIEVIKTKIDYTMDRFNQHMQMMQRSMELAHSGFNDIKRVISARLRTEAGLDAYPILNVDYPKSLEPITKKEQILGIVIKALPTPDESTSWEQIIDFRSDENSRSKFLALRNWMNEIARSELSAIEIAEKLEYLLDQYQQHMKVHKIKTNLGTMQTLITTTADIAGNLASFRWGKVAESIFSLKNRNIALLQGELTSPGNEVAFIVKAKDTFG